MTRLMKSNSNKREIFVGSQMDLRNAERAKNIYLEKKNKPAALVARKCM